MQYAVVNGQRSEAFPSGTGSCPDCGAPMMAKCGPRVIHHWAHVGRLNCDPWWENETEWHRQWKNLYPPQCREVSHVAQDGEIHRADIKTPTGIVIEAQHSSMTDIERVSREEFYKNIIWIIDGRPFRKNFDIYHLLPNPTSELAADLVWIKAKRNHHGANRGLFMRWSEARKKLPGIAKSEVKYGWMHGIDDIQDAVNASYNGYHQYDWVKPRATWLDSPSPIYIDFGDDHLINLCVYDSSGLKCIRRVAKRKFVHDSLCETRAQDIATRFYPLPK
jgi:competence protein CoiA